MQQQFLSGSVSADKVGTKLVVERYDEFGDLNHKLTTDLAEFFTQQNILPIETTTDASTEEFFTETTIPEKIPATYTLIKNAESSC